jgi:hypothetical protein
MRGASRAEALPAAQVMVRPGLGHRAFLGEARERPGPVAHAHHARQRRDAVGRHLSEKRKGCALLS